MWSRPKLVQGALATLLAALLVALAACGGTSPSTGSSGLAGTSPRPTTAAAGGPSVTPVPTTRPASPAPAAVAFLDPALMEANRTPWPLESISAGSSICGVGTDQRLRCWSNADPAPEGRYEEVAVGDGTACGIRPDGTVGCWGGAGLHSPKGRFTELAVAQGRACGVRTDGSVTCWWSEDTEDGGLKAVTRAPSIPDGVYTDLSVSVMDGGCALRDDGTLACWGIEEPVPTPRGTYISLGDSCGVRDTGEIECFGYNEWYGDGPAPELPEGPFVAMDGARFRGCAMRASGTLSCWGDGGYDAAERPLPYPTPPGTWRAVSVGEYYACALGTDNHAVCWGVDTGSARPAPTMQVDAAAFVTDGEASVSWRATPVFAEITTYDVQYTTDGWGEDDEGNPIEPRWVPLLDGTSETSASIEGDEGASYCWRVRAHDAEGIVSDWSWSYYCTAVPIDERSLTATGPWTAIEGPGYYKGTALTTSTKGATLLISQEGAFGLVILASTCGGCGTFTLRYPEPECWVEEEEAVGMPSLPPATCPPGSEPVELRGPRSDSAIAFMGNNGEEGYGGPLELVVTSSGKPVTIDGVIFADTE